VVSISLHCVFAEILPSKYFPLKLHTKVVNTCIDLQKAFVLRDINNQSVLIFLLNSHSV